MVESNNDICKGLVIVFTVVGIVSIILFLVEKDFSNPDNTHVKNFLNSSDIKKETSLTNLDKIKEKNLTNLNKIKETNLTSLFETK